MGELHDLPWVPIAIIFGAIIVCFSIRAAVARVEDKLNYISGQLREIDELIGRIPGVEDYREPTGAQWAMECQRNPGANNRNRRNWIKD
jgi:hypothetical protein